MKGVDDTSFPGDMADRKRSWRHRTPGLSALKKKMVLEYVIKPAARFIRRVRGENAHIADALFIWIWNALIKSDFDKSLLKYIYELLYIYYFYLSTLYNTKSSQIGLNVLFADLTYCKYNIYLFESSI